MSLRIDFVNKEGKPDNQPLVDKNNDNKINDPEEATSALSLTDGPVTADREYSHEELVAIRDGKNTPTGGTTAGDGIAVGVSVGLKYKLGLGELGHSGIAGDAYVVPSWKL